MIIWVESLLPGTPPEPEVGAVRGEPPRMERMKEVGQMLVQGLVIAVLLVLVVAFFTGYLGHHRRPIGATTGGTVTRTAPDTFVSWLAVVLLPVLFVVWFVLGSVLIGDPNEPTAPKGWDGAWRVVVLWLIVSTAPVVGIVFGRRAVRRNEQGGRAAFVTNIVVFGLLTALTLGGGLSDALS